MSTHFFEEIHKLNSRSFFNTSTRHQPGQRRRHNQFKHRCQTLYVNSKDASACRLRRRRPRCVAIYVPHIKTVNAKIAKISKFLSTGKTKQFYQTLIIQTSAILSNQSNQPKTNPPPNTHIYMPDSSQNRTDQNQPIFSPRRSASERTRNPITSMMSGRASAAIIERAIPAAG